MQSLKLQCNATYIASKCFSVCWYNFFPPFSFSYFLFSKRCTPAHSITQNSRRFTERCQTERELNIYDRCWINEFDSFGWPTSGGLSLHSPLLHSFHFKWSYYTRVPATTKRTKRKKRIKHLTALRCWANILSLMIWHLTHYEQSSNGKKNSVCIHPFKSHYYIQ